MCGISAIVAPTKTSDDDAAASPQERDLRTKLHEQMQASLNNIKHRGPDSTGIWISSDERIGLISLRIPFFWNKCMHVKVWN